MLRAVSPVTTSSGPARRDRRKTNSGPAATMRRGSASCVQRIGFFAAFDTNAFIESGVTYQPWLEQVYGSFNASRLKQIEQDRVDSRDQSIALIESAAVGLSARGLSHEVRTHLGEIKQRLGSIQRAVKLGPVHESDLLPHLREILASCAAISNAASLIDPMLPRASAIKDTFELLEFVEDYVKKRKLL